MKSTVLPLFNSKWFKWFGRIAVATILLWLVFTRVDFTKTFQTLREINPIWLIPLIALYLFNRFIWAWQMSLGLAPLQSNFSVFHLYKILLISTFYSLVFPGGMVAGGAASLYKLSSKSGKPAEAGALLAYFRIVNTLMVFAIGLVGMIFDQKLAQPSLQRMLSVIFILSIMVFLPLLSTRVSQFFGRILKYLLDRFRIKGRPKQFIVSLWQVLSSMIELPKSTVILAFGLALVSHLLGILLYWVIAQNLNIELSIYTLGWIRTFLTVIQMLPLTIGGLGVREVSVVFLLREYGVLEAKALAFSLILFSLMVVTGVIGGVLEGLDILKKLKTQNIE